MTRLSEKLVEENVGLADDWYAACVHLVVKTAARRLAVKVSRVYACSRQ